MRATNHLLTGIILQVVTSLIETLRKNLNNLYKEILGKHLLLSLFGPSYSQKFGNFFLRSKKSHPQSDPFDSPNEGHQQAPLKVTYDLWVLSRGHALTNLAKVFSRLHPPTFNSEWKPLKNDGLEDDPASFWGKRPNF